MASLKSNYDAIVIGGGFYGCNLALELKRRGYEVVIFEKESKLLTRASFVNQARVHNGYHYPRSLTTAIRSRINSPLFLKEYKSAIDTSFDKYYAIARYLSKISSQQYLSFCRRIQAPIKDAPAKIKSLFNSDLIEDIFATKEYAFDADELRRILRQKLINNKIPIMFNTSVIKVGKSKTRRVRVIAENDKKEQSYFANLVINATYSSINEINKKSHLSAIPLKHELTEMALIKVPEELKKLGITIMCGPFFSVMPFPASDGLHSLSHVRYTPHKSWTERDKLPELLDNESAYPYMIRDAIRYIPKLSDSVYMKSLWEIKTVLPQSEADDSRPILFQESKKLPGYICIMGGKIDNIYDAFKELENYLQKS